MQTKLEQLRKQVHDAISDPHPPLGPHKVDGRSDGISIKPIRCAHYYWARARVLGYEVDGLTISFLLLDLVVVAQHSQERDERTVGPYGYG